MATNSGHYDGYDRRTDVYETIAWTFVLTLSLLTAAVLVTSAAVGWEYGIAGHTHPALNVLVGVALPAWAFGAFAHDHGLGPF